MIFRLRAAPCVVLAVSWIVLPSARADDPIVKFVSVPDFLNMDFQLNDPRLMDLTNARKAQLVAEINAGGPQASLNPHVGNFVGTVENGYRGASQVLLEALAAEQADFLTVSGDLLYTRWPKNGQLGSAGAAQHIRNQADIYYDAWIENVENHAGFGLEDIYTIVGDHEVGDNPWGASKRALIPTYKDVYVDKVGQAAMVTGGAYVNAPAGFEGRTYAVQRGNLLVVGVDQFETFNSSGQFTQVANQIASVKIDVTGSQLTWLENTLDQAQNDPTIDHVVVMAHAPIAAQEHVIIQATSSGLMNATDETGPWWQAMSSHSKVRAYLPGEVHEISMQRAGGLLQLVSGTNIFQPTDQAGVSNIGFNLAGGVNSEENYVVFEVYEDRIDVAIKQIETVIWGNSGLANDPINDEPYKNREARVATAVANAGFQTIGTLTIDTSGPEDVYRNRTGYFLTEWTYGAPTNLDLNNDGFIDVADVQRFLQYFRTSMTGLTAMEAYSRGDLNGDFLSNYLDFRLFKDAYDVDQGGGAFAAVLAHVPEPVGLILVGAGAVCFIPFCRRRHTSHRAMQSVCALAIAGWLSASVQAAPVVGWIAADSQSGGATAKQLSQANTNSPVLGDGNENGATTGAGQVALYADISGVRDGAADIALADGQKVVLKGTVELFDIASSMEQFRWGLFYEPAPTFDALGWQGYFATNVASGNGGALRAKPGGNNSVFVANTDSTNIATAISNNAAFSSGRYDFSMTATRLQNSLVLDASLHSGDGAYQADWLRVIPTNPNHVLFNFNRVGFLSGNGMNADQLVFSNIDVAVLPAELLTLQVIESGPGAGRVQIKNSSATAIDLDYYEITSVSGALNLGGWTSLDEQENGDPVGQGWDEAGGNTTKLLSEINFETTTTVAGGASLSLGSAFNVGGSRDLFFSYGRPGSPLLPGLVTYLVGVAGDYNGDAVVDAADYVAWRATLGDNVSNGTAADGDGDGTIGPGDYEVWRTNFGKSAFAASAGASAVQATTLVPEPAASVLVIIAAFMLQNSRTATHSRTATRSGGVVTRTVDHSLRGGARGPAKVPRQSLTRASFASARRPRRTRTGSPATRIRLSRTAAQEATRSERA